MQRAFNIECSFISIDDFQSVLSRKRREIFSHVLTLWSVRSGSICFSLFSLLMVRMVRMGLDGRPTFTFGCITIHTRKEGGGGGKEVGASRFGACEYPFLSIFISLLFFQSAFLSLFLSFFLFYFPSFFFTFLLSFLLPSFFVLLFLSLFLSMFVCFFVCLFVSFYLRCFYSFFLSFYYSFFLLFFLSFILSFFFPSSLRATISIDERLFQIYLLPSLKWALCFKPLFIC